MKRKNFKPSNKYRRDFGSMRGRGGDSKRLLLIAIAVAVAVVVMVTVVIAILFANGNAAGTSSNQVGANNSNDKPLVNDVPSAPEEDVLVSNRP